jgi:MurE/MurF fusion protein
MTTSPASTWQVKDVLTHLGQDAQLLRGQPHSEVKRIRADSRGAGVGDLFVALPGATPTSKHGRDYAHAAASMGACVVLDANDAAHAPTNDVAVIVVPGLAARFGLLVHAHAGRPSSRARVVGITGTNGKTSVSFFLAQMARVLQTEGFVLGTLGVGPPDRPRHTGFTTPTADVLAGALQELVSASSSSWPLIGMEVSSHALAIGRVDGVQFAAAAFTNFSQDHLDFHGTMDAYFEAKASLFRTHLPAHAPAVVPVALAQRLGVPRAWRFGARSDNADVCVEDLQLTTTGMSGRLCTPGGSASFSSPLVGAFNVDNVMVAAALMISLGANVADVASALSTLAPPPGRMQRIRGDGGGPVVLVDYAHTPDALARALQAARGFCSERLWVVCGCGGDRDASKRAPMAEVAAGLADRIILTDDNPRSEDHNAILDAMAAGLPSTPLVDSAPTAMNHCARIADRRAAILTAVTSASDDDVVLVAGKGHERGQERAGVVWPFADAREAERALRWQHGPSDLPHAFVASVLGAASTGRDRTADGIYAGVSTDSRAVEEGSLFVALKGDNFDGHAYVEAALAQGAKGAVVDRSFVPPTNVRASLFVVDDTLHALQALGRAQIERCQAVRIGLTGSNGKTTTKEMLLGALRSHAGAAAVLGTEGNLNNHIGVPLTALRSQPFHRFAVFEMGMNHLEEIRSYCRIVTPTVGLITNMGSAHAGNVGGLEGVAKAKAELWDSIGAVHGAKGTLVVLADDARCVREAARVVQQHGCRSIHFGQHAPCDVRVQAVFDDGAGVQRIELVHQQEVVSVSLAIDGAHNAVNAAGAVACAMAVGVPFAVAAAGLSDARLAHGRMERKQRSDSLLVLDDSYNANPDSMHAGLDALKNVALKTHRRRVAALGVMLELGSLAEDAHHQLGVQCAGAGLAHLFVCGALGERTRAGALQAGMPAHQVTWAADSAALAPHVQAFVQPNDVLLIKGSRGARMERVLQALWVNEPNSAGGR